MTRRPLTRRPRTGACASKGLCFESSGAKLGEEKVSMEAVTGWASAFPKKMNLEMSTRGFTYAVCTSTGA